MSTAAHRQGRGRWRLSIAAFQGFFLGGLVFLTLVGLLVVTLYTAYRNTSELLEDKARLLLASLTSATSRYLDATQAPVDYVALLIERGELDPDDRRRLYEILNTGLAATPQIHGFLFIDARGWMAMASRKPQGGIAHTLERWRDDPRIAAAMAKADARGTTAPFWGAPFYTEDAGTILNLRRPVRGARFLGMVVAALSVAELSEYVASLESEPGQSAFILYDRDYVLAHPALVHDFEGLSSNRPLPKVTEVGDPVLFNIWRDDWQENRLNIGSGHHDELAGTGYIFLYAPLGDYADVPWLVGSYFREDQVGSQIVRVFQAGVIGVLLIVLTMAAALFLVRTIRTPIVRLAEAATRVQALEFDRVPVLPASRLRELDEAVGAFNAMVAALRAFAWYVPRDLIRQLLQRGDLAGLASETREVTVLFTDIVGFTTRTEQLSAAATAAFLNHHFALVSRCIEAEGGTIDKYIGDGSMALWNTAESQPDHPVRAARAARAIASALHADNAVQPLPVRLRIGVHSGPVVVGNIGTAMRMNYTVVGDTVNIANRLESLARELLPDAEVAVLISAATAAALPADLPVTSLGRHGLRGRDAPTEVFALVAS